MVTLEPLADTTKTLGKTASAAAAAGSG